MARDEATHRQRHAPAICLAIAVVAMIVGMVGVAVTEGSSSGFVRLAVVAGVAAVVAFLFVVAGRGSGSRRPETPGESESGES